MAGGKFLFKSCAVKCTLNTLVMKSNNQPNTSALQINGENKQDEKVDFSYPAGEDIYANAKEETEIDPENISELKSLNEDERFTSLNEKSFKDDVSGDDLDIPGAELDDAQEDVGSEDEENNGYSLGQR